MGFMKARLSPERVAPKPAMTATTPTASSSSSPRDLDVTPSPRREAEEQQYVADRLALKQLELDAALNAVELKKKSERATRQQSEQPVHAKAPKTVPKPQVRLSFDVLPQARFLGS